MTQIAYSVICTIDFPTKVEEWIDWLKNGHIDDVIAGGALSGEIVKMDIDPNDSISQTIEVRYKFESREKFEEYLDNHAPRLRAEGLEKFPMSDGFHYRRTIGEIIA